MRAAIVGAGLGGLAAACRLAGRGHEVVVLEREAAVGGRAAQWRAGGYAIDAGPTVLTMPALVEETLAAAGASAASTGLTLRRLDPAYRACFADGSELRVRADPEAMAAEIRAVCGPQEAAAFGRFTGWLERLYRLEMAAFIDRNYDSPFDLVRQPAALAALVRLGGLRRLAPTVGRFFHDGRLVRLFSFQAMYAGLSPFEALALFAVITYMDSVAGVFFPVGGVHAVAAALARGAASAGAVVRTKAEAVGLERSPGGALTGVRLAGGEVVPAEVAVINADLPVAYRELLGVAPPKRAEHGRYSPSCVVRLAGARGPLPAGAEHHNIHFGAAWHGAFDDLLRQGIRMRDPSVLVTVPTVTDPTLAPSGAHALYALEPAPNLDGRLDWTRPEEAERAAAELAARVEALGYPAEVEVERVIDPAGWAAQGVERGAPFGLAHRFFQTGPFRPANVDAAHPGVVFVGANTTPGVGIPMVLLSGRLAAERAEHEAARRR